MINRVMSGFAYPPALSGGKGKHQKCRLSSAAALDNRHRRKFLALGGVGVGNSE